MCEDENISRTVDYDDTGGNDHGSGVSGDKPDDDITDRLNGQVGRSKDRMRQLPPNAIPQQALANQGRASSDGARFLATVPCYLINLPATPLEAVSI